MSDTVRFHPDCSYCFHHLRHGIARHDASIALTARLNKMSGPVAPDRTCPTRMRIRLSQLLDRRERLEHCVQVQRDEGTRDFLRRELEIVSGEISLIQTELEAAQ